MKTARIYGLISGFVFCSLSTLTLDGYLPNNFLVTLLVYAIFIALPIIKEYLNNGKQIAFADAFKIGLTVAVITATLNGIYLYCYFEFLRPEWIKTHLAEALSQLKSSKKYIILSPESQKEQIDDLVKGFTSRIQSLGQLVGFLIGGAVLSLFISVVMSLSKKQNNVVIKK